MSVTFRNAPKEARTAPPQAQAPSESATPAYFASDLTKDGSLAFICHQDQVYTLRITRAGKLILTK